MTDKEAFEAWWKLLKPAECDEVEAHFRDCWNVAINHERERCAKVCILVVRDASMAGRCLDSEHDYVAAAHDCAEAIRMGKP